MHTTEHQWKRCATRAHFDLSLVSLIWAGKLFAWFAPSMTMEIYSWVWSLESSVFLRHSRLSLPKNSICAFSCDLSSELFKPLSIKHLVALLKHYIQSIIETVGPSTLTSNYNALSKQCGNMTAVQPSLLGKPLKTRVCKQCRPPFENIWNVTLAMVWHFIFHLRPCRIVMTDPKENFVSNLFSLSSDKWLYSSNISLPLSEEDCMADRTSDSTAATIRSYIASVIVNVCNGVGSVLGGFSAVEPSLKIDCASKG